MTRSTDQRTRPGTWRLYFDLKGVSLTETDGAQNPAWCAAADRYNVVGGDLGAMGSTYVAVYECTPDAHRGRDSQGRAVRLLPIEGDA